MKQARFRFLGSLRDFLPADRRGDGLVYGFSGSQSVKHLIESLGAPHPEVGTVRVNGREVEWSYQVQDGDEVEVHEASLARCGRDRFVLDAHLGRLAAYLRMLGFDSLYRPDCGDEELARAAGEEGRVLLTRDRSLLMRSAVVWGYYVRETNPRRQLPEVVRRFGLEDLIDPFRRCLRCNTLLRQADAPAVRDRVPPRSREYYSEFWECPGCRRVYWGGSHYRRMQALVEDIRRG
jgi:hypothetical protein